MNTADPASPAVDLGQRSNDASSSMREAVLNWSGTRKRVAVTAVDVFLSLAATWLAFTLRLDAPHRPAGAEWMAYLLSPALLVAAFVTLGLYRAMFRHTGMAALVATGKAVAAYGAAFAPVVWALFLWDGVPRSLMVLQPVILLVLVVASRAFVSRTLGAGRTPGAKRLLIYGAGRAGVQTAAALAGVPHYQLVGYLDDDAAKTGRSINGVHVYSPDDAECLTRRLAISDVLLALPSVTRSRRNAIIARLQALPLRIRSLPGLEDLTSGRVTFDDFRDLDLEDLLGRDPVQVRQDLLDRCLSGRTVLVTGAGGSIGSELCRQILHQVPKELVLAEHSEHALYAIHQELSKWVTRTGASVTVSPLLLNVCDFERVHAIFMTHRPAVVYHAAAYKHVPMVEANPGQGIINNVLGTMNLARAALEAGVERFVLVSTDKAVRPTNIMGATKRVAEQILQSVSDFYSPASPGVSTNASPGPKTVFSMVRFGNVLGSSGSVVPLFRAQLAQGGPLTVTHPEVTRYFMTIPEAAQLVLHAGAMAEGGDLFVLDMGTPIRVLDLAKRMVALSGLTLRDETRPMGDIQVVFSGLRPGEKLFEELLIGENPLPTAHPRIIRAREEFLRWPELEVRLEVLLAAARNGDADAMRRALKDLVSGYAPAVSDTETLNELKVGIHA